jgi:hypothetical protein
VRLRGPIVALTRFGRELWIGTNALPDLYDVDTMRGGLHRLALDTGEVTTFEKELPKVNYAFDGEPELLGPVATAGVATSGTARLAVTRAGLVQIDTDGKLTPKNINVDGAIAVPTHLVTDEARGVGLLSTDKGLVTLDLATLAVKAFVSAADLGGKELGALALDQKTGAVFVVVYGDANASRVVRVLGAQRTPLLAGSSGVAEGSFRDIVFSPKRDRLYIAVQSFKEATGGVVEWDGNATASTLFVEGDLAHAIDGAQGPFGTRTLGLDDADGILVVGGGITQTIPLGPLAGGGLVFVNLDDKKLQGALPGEQVVAIAVDEDTRRFYVSSLFPCSEVKLRNKGLVALSFRADGSLRTERPLLSGVRAIATEQDGDVLVGLRDDKPGFGCDGFPIQTGLYALRSNRSGELLPLTSSSPDVLISPDAGPVALDVASDGKLAIDTFVDANFVGQPASGVVVSPTEFGVSNYGNDIAFVTPSSLWMAGRATHTPNDPPNADIGPRGAARLTLAADGSVASHKHFVRGSSDPADIVGLPSGDVRATLVAADGNSYLLCATEKASQNNTDREQGIPYVLNGKTYLGGIARVGTNDAIATVTDSTITPDPRAGAFSPDGRLVVADAVKGLLSIEGFAGPGAPVVTPIAGNAIVPSNAIPTSVWVGAGDDLVVTYDKGVYRSFAGEKTFSAREGYAWSTHQVGPVVLVGAEDGLTLLRPQGAPAPLLPAIEKGALPPYTPAK